MKVLIVSTVRFYVNGITSVILNYYRNMDKNGMQIDFVIPNEIGDEYRTELEQNRSNIYYIPRKSNPLSYQRKLYNIMKENSYDIVHVHGNSAMMLLDILPAKKANIPVRIVHCHNTTCSHKVLHKMFLPIFNKCYTHGFACGQDAGKWLYGDGCFEELKNGIDLEKYRYDESVRAEYREKIGAKNKTIIGHIGNFIEQKNHAFLLDWFSELIKEDSNYLLLLISDGGLLEPMKKKSQDLGIDDNVLFLGKTTEISQYLQAMDLFVLPSLYEGLPVVLVEAQAAGLPCFVSDKVSKEADLTNSLCFLDITDRKEWVRSIRGKERMLKNMNRTKVCEDWQKMIAENGYDIVHNAERMKSLYYKYCNEF